MISIIIMLIKGYMERQTERQTDTTAYNLSYQEDWNGWWVKDVKGIVLVQRKIQL